MPRQFQKHAGKLRQKKSAQRRRHRQRHFRRRRSQAPAQRQWIAPRQQHEQRKQAGVAHMVTRVGEPQTQPQQRIVAEQRQQPAEINPLRQEHPRLRLVKRRLLRPPLGPHEHEEAVLRAQIDHLCSLSRYGDGERHRSSPQRLGRRRHRLAGKQRHPSRPDPMPPPDLQRHRHRATPRAPPPLRVVQRHAQPQRLPRGRGDWPDCPTTAATPLPDVASPPLVSDASRLRQKIPPSSPPRPAGAPFRCRRRQIPAATRPTRAQPVATTPQPAARKPMMVGKARARVGVHVPRDRAQARPETKTP